MSTRENARASREELDELDLRIVDLLSENARAPLKVIADKLNVTRLTVTRRLKKLMQRDLIAFNVGLNLRKLGYRTAYIGVEIKGQDRRKNVVDLLKNCPRVISILQPEEEANIMVYCYGETNATLESFIGSMRDSYMDRIIYVHYSDPPVYPDNICIKAYPVKTSEAPCGRNCEDCESYTNRRCLGCPAVKGYRGMI